MQDQDPKGCACKPVDDRSFDILWSSVEQLKKDVSQMEMKLFTGNGKNALITDIELLYTRLDDLSELMETHQAAHDKEARTRVWLISMLVTAILTLFTTFYMTESPSEKRYNERLELLQDDLNHNKEQLNLVLEKLATLQKGLIKE